MKFGAIIQIVPNQSEWWGGFRQAVDSITGGPPKPEDWRAFDTWELRHQGHFREVINAVYKTFQSAMPIASYYFINPFWPIGTRFMDRAAIDAPAPVDSLIAGIPIPGVLQEDSCAQQLTPVVNAHPDIRRWMLGQGLFDPLTTGGVYPVYWSLGPDRFYDVCARELRKFAAIIRGIIPDAEIIGPAFLPGGIERVPHGLGAAREFAQVVAEVCDTVSWLQVYVCDTRLGSPVESVNQHLRFLNVSWLPEIESKKKIVAIRLPHAVTAFDIPVGRNFQHHIPDEDTAVAILRQAVGGLAEWGADEVWLMDWDHSNFDPNDPALYAGKRKDMLHWGGFQGFVKQSPWIVDAPQIDLEAEVYQAYVDWKPEVVPYRKLIDETVRLAQKYNEV